MFYIIILTMIMMIMKANRSGEWNGSLGRLFQGQAVNANVPILSYEKDTII